MPQMQLPIFPKGATPINANLGFVREENTITYIYGHLPVFMHDADDHRSFRMVTSQFYVNGGATQSQICRAFGVSPISLKRGVKLYREKGIAGFFEQPRRRGSAVLTTPVLAEVQGLLDEGLTIPEIATKLELLSDTLRKAVRAGKLHQPQKKKPENPVLARVSNKSDRSAVDAAAPIGMGATDIAGRLATSIFGNEALPPLFKACLDIPKGGVLLALPALLAVGLLAHSARYFQLPRGFYRLDTIFLVLAFMALARVKSMEELRYCPPGEWGKLLGLDRIPEVKTLRDKLGILSEEGEARAWAGELGRDWMAEDPVAAGILYIDGHVRVYHGYQTELPRHYVSRQKLCQRATTDYWVNAMDGQPFFVVTKAIDPGLLRVLEEEIVPRLEAEVPCQPDLFELTQDPYLHRFTMVFDREGYSPGFAKRTHAKRIACQTYNKFPGDDWPAEEFTRQSVKLSNGNVVLMRLAERGVLLEKDFWVREIRKLTENGHQTSIVSTDYRSDYGPMAAAMFARWSQENFFRYMRQHYGLDRLADYSTEGISDTEKVVNPQYREVDGEVRKQVNILNRKRREFGAVMLEEEIEPRKVEAYQRQKADLREEIAELEQTVADLKACRKQTPKHVTMADLPAEDRFLRLGTKSKYLIDTIKMIAYRAETAMVSIVRETMSRSDDARSLLRAIYAAEVDLLPDPEAETLTVRLHQLANRSSGKSVQHLCGELNATRTIFPGTNLRLVYELVT